MKDLRNNISNIIVAVLAVAFGILAVVSALNTLSGLPLIFGATAILLSMSIRV